MFPVDEDFKNSSFCFPVGCVQVKRGKNTVIIRDSKDPDGSALEFTHEEWDAFIKGVKENEFDVS